MLLNWTAVHTSFSLVVNSVRLSTCVCLSSCKIQNKSNQFNNFILFLAYDFFLFFFRWQNVVPCPKFGQTMKNMYTILMKMNGVHHAHKVVFIPLEVSSGCACSSSPMFPFSQCRIKWGDTDKCSLLVPDLTDDLSACAAITVPACKSRHWHFLRGGMQTAGTHPCITQCIQYVPSKSVSLRAECVQLRLFVVTLLSPSLTVPGLAG